MNIEFWIGTGLAQVPLLLLVIGMLKRRGAATAATALRLDRLEGDVKQVRAEQALMKAEQQVARDQLTEIKTDVRWIRESMERGAR